MAVANETYRCPLATIDLQALRANYRAIRSRLRNAGLCAVIKSDAYGHGLVPCARALADEGVERLAIGSTAEIVALREAGIDQPLVRVIPAYGDDLAAGLRHGVEEIIVSLDQAKTLSSRAAAGGRTARVHVDVDTGMGRKGLLPDTALDEIDAIAALPAIEIAALMTHFPDAEATPSLCAQQTEQLLQLREALRDRGVAVPAVHLANSAGAIWQPGSHGDYVRAGVALYGVSPGPERDDQLDLQPVMTVTAPVVNVRTLPAGYTVGYGRTYRIEKPTRVATLGIGYSDGFFRVTSNRAFVLLRGKRLPVIGVVSMGLVTANADAVPDASVDDTATIIGRDGDQQVTANDFARWADTIGYEVVCRFGCLPRRYR